MKENKILMAVLMLAATSATANAQASKDPSKVDPGTYTVDSRHTQVLFAISHFGFSTFHGVFPNATGSLVLDGKSPGASSGEISLPIDSLTTTNSKLDTELKGADWFDSAKFPAATFKITKVTPTGTDAAQIDGDLTLHGVTKPITLAAHLVGAGVNPMMKKTTIGFDAAGKIKRSDFGVTKFAPMIGDDVELTISVAAEK